MLFSLLESSVDRRLTHRTRDANLAAQRGNGQHMQIGVIGLGRMGGNIVRRLTKAGHACVVYDANPEPGAALAKEGATAAASVPALVEALGPTPRTVWVMLPAGKITEDTIAQLAGLMTRRRRHHRRRQHQLQRRRAPRARAGAQGNPISRHRHVGRRVGPGARLLPDDRRRRRDGEAPRSDLFRAGARPRRHRAHGRPREARSARRARLHPRRAGGGGAFREDDP